MCFADAKKWKKQINLLKKISNFLSSSYRIICVCGPSGSGKSSVVSFLLNLPEAEYKPIWCNGSLGYKLCVSKIYSEIFDNEKKIPKTEKAEDDSMMKVEKFINAHNDK